MSKDKNILSLINISYKLNMGFPELIIAIVLFLFLSLVPFTIHTLSARGNYTLLRNLIWNRACRVSFIYNLEAKRRGHLLKRYPKTRFWNHQVQ